MLTQFLICLRSPFAPFQKSIILILIIFSWFAASAQIPNQIPFHKTTNISDTNLTSTIPIDKWIREEYFRWNDTTATWNPIYRNSITRDTQNRITELIEEVFGSNGYSLDNRLTFGYLGNDTRWNEYIAQEWNGATWENISRDLRQFDFQENITLSTSEIWVGGVWEFLGGFRYLHSYDANNNLVETIEEKANSDGIYEPLGRTRFSYTAINQIDTAWLDVRGGPQYWFELRRTFDFQWYDYSQRLPQSFTIQDPPSNNLDFLTRHTFNYGQNNSPIETVEEFNGGIWSFRRRTKKIFDGQMRNTSNEFFCTKTMLG